MATAVCVTDMLNSNVEKVVEPIAALVERAGDEGVEVVYVNDNYGDWNSSQEELAERAMAGRRPDLVEPLLPPDDVMERNMRAELTACADCRLEG